MAGCARGDLLASHMLSLIGSLCFDRLAGYSSSIFGALTLRDDRSFERMQNVSKKAETLEYLPDRLN